MSTIPIDILFGRSKKDVYESRNNEAVNRMREKLARAFVDIGAQKTRERLDLVPDAVIEAVMQDLHVFARQCMAFFFSQQAAWPGLTPVHRGKRHYESASGPPITLDLATDLDGSGSEVVAGGSGMPFITIPPSASSFQPIIWPGLRLDTLKRKRRLGGAGMTTFFIYRQDLRRELRSDFETMLNRIFSPKITIQTTNTYDSLPSGQLLSQNGVRIGSVKVRLFSDPSDVSPLRGALIDDDWGRADDDLPLLTKYLSEESALKLAGREHSHGPANRPWVGPALAFWVLNRAPSIVANAVIRAAKPRRVRYRGADLGG